MSGMSWYYASRAVISVAFAVFLTLSGMVWWVAGLLSLVVFGLFLWAPHGGRYVVHPELGITALRRDDRTQSINDKAARNAFVATMLAIGGIALYFGAANLQAVPVTLLEQVLIVGILIYFVSDFFLRRA